MHIYSLNLSGLYSHTHTHSLTLPLSFCFYYAVVTFEFIDTSAEGTEGSEVINVTITQSVATAAPITLTVTPTEYSPEFGTIPPLDQASPNIATRMYMYMYIYARAHVPTL